MVPITSVRQCGACFKTLRRCNKPLKLVTIICTC
ncbi:hypothetical protein KP509_05G089900 [Ceratopteris richardii]|uniref:Uncharacterized protein n=1 Tax=Ceratopteris richardii TaxID=49495 RepID=A0A8T2UV96_CERRI|nr:hypothetical protein KP509_05G089900 [Ceratopteris richardii]